ncbi:MAG: nitroreductase family protein [Gemmatimonadetes bacterium]|nr:nitroreductase family protein [Gemmatimonadota bacterium]
MTAPPDGGRPAPVEAPVHDLIARRWSPRAFDERPVDAAVLRSVFEAARWAPSSFNEQPWRFLLATTDEPEWIDRLRGYLTEGNAWARRAPVLAASACRTTFTRNGLPNRMACRDLGAAEQNLVLEAYHRGLVAHQMAGFDHRRLADELLPDGFEPGSMLALGWPGEHDLLPDEKRRDRRPRERRPLDELVFSGEWGRPSAFL